CLYPGGAPSRLPALRRSPWLDRSVAPASSRAARHRGVHHRTDHAGGFAVMSWFDSWEEIEAVALCDDPVERAIARASAAVRPLLDGALAGRELSVADGELLLESAGDDLVA